LAQQPDPPADYFGQWKERQEFAEQPDPLDYFAQPGALAVVEVTMVAVEVEVEVEWAAETVVWEMKPAVQVVPQDLDDWGAGKKRRKILQPEC
jgi:hypothetical protein